MISYLSLYVQNTLGYSPVQAGLRFLPLTLASFTVALLTGRLLGKVAMRVLPGAGRLAAGVASGVGIRVAAAVPPAARAAVAHAARAGTASGLNDVLLAAAAFAVLGAIAGFAFGPDPAKTPPPSPPPRNRPVLTTGANPGPQSLASV